MKSYSGWVFIFYLAVLVLGGFFVTNLFLAVLFDEFLTAKRVDKATDAMEGRAPATAPAAPSAVEPSSAAQAGEKKGAADKAPADKRRGSANKGAAAKGAAPKGKKGVKARDSKEDDARATLLEDGAARSDEPETTAAAFSPSAEGASAGCCDAVALGLRAAAESSWLSNGSTVLVLLNMVFMTLPYYGMPEWYASALEQGIACVTWLFTLEMALKLLGLGCSEYWSDGWNCLDGSLVTFSMMELLLEEVLRDLFGDIPKLSFLRVLRAVFVCVV